MYKLVDGGVIKIDGGVTISIPDSPTNRHWREYQRWLATGNQPEPADPEPEPGPTKEEIEIEATNLLKKLGVSNDDAVRLVELLRRG